MKSILALIAIILITKLPAQEDFYAMDSDVLELSAFEVISSSSQGYDPRYRRSNLSTNSVRLVKRADIVILELTVMSDNKKPEKRIANLQEAFAELKRATAARSDIIMKSGYVELPLVTSNRWNFSSAKTSEEISSFNVQLITKMNLTDTVFDRSTFLNEFIDSIELGDVKVLYVSSGVAILNPDSYRNELLELIAREVELLGRVFSTSNEFLIRGLDQKVSVRQIDGVNLEISLPYQLIISRDSSQGSIK